MIIRLLVMSFAISSITAAQDAGPAHNFDYDRNAPLDGHALTQHRGPRSEHVVQRAQQLDALAVRDRAHDGAPCRGEGRSRLLGVDQFDAPPVDWRYDAAQHHPPPLELLAQSNTGERPRHRGAFLCFDPTGARA